MRTRVIDLRPVYFSWCSLVPYPSRLRVLSASRTSTRSPTFAVTPVDERFMVALTRSQAAVRMACLCSRTDFQKVLLSLLYEIIETSGLCGAV